MTVGRKNIYVQFSPSHAVLYNEWFLPTLPDALDVVVDEVPQIGAMDQHCFGTEAFNEATRRKIDVWISAAKENWNSWFVYADVDIQFFGPIRGMISSLLHGKHILFQAAPGVDFFGRMTIHANTGFIAARGCRQVVDLFESAKDACTGNDQNCVNHVLLGYDEVMRRTSDSASVVRPLVFRGVRAVHRTRHKLGLGPDGLRFGLFPSKYVIGGDQSAFPPETTLVHHATHARGVDAKIDQLISVRSLLSDR